MTDIMEEGKTLAGRYGQLEADRTPYLQRARKASKLTNPGLFPPAGTTGASRLKDPEQSFGAQAVNSLAAKIVAAIFPSGQTFFRLDVDEVTLQRLMAVFEGQPEQQAAQAAVILQGLAKVERTVLKHLEASTLRAKLTELVKQIIVGGTSVLHIEDPKKARVFRLDTFVLKLDPTGTLIELILKEKVHILTLTEEVRAACGVTFERGKHEEVELYTGIALVGPEKYSVHQEINSKPVPGSEGSYPADKLPYLPVRFFTVDGESYGRSYVDDYIGDLEALEGLSKAIVQGSAAAAKVLFLVKNGRTSKRALTKAPNGEFIDGDIQDVGVLQLGKFADFKITSETADKIERRLAMAFLMTTAIQRNGERVTAEEIKRLADELEGQLGGIYTMLSQTLQLPLVNVTMGGMTRRKALPPLPKDVVSMSITTGMDALGRGAEAARLNAFKAAIADVPGALAAVRWTTFISRLLVAMGIDEAGLVKTPEEMLAEQRQAQMAEFMSKTGQAVAPDIVRAGLEQGGATAQAAPAQ